VPGSLTEQGERPAGIFSDQVKGSSKDALEERFNRTGQPVQVGPGAPSGMGAGSARKAVKRPESPWSDIGYLSKVGGVERRRLMASYN